MLEFLYDIISISDLEIDLIHTVSYKADGQNRYAPDNRMDQHCVYGKQSTHIPCCTDRYSTEKLFQQIGIHFPKNTRVLYAELHLHRSGVICTEFKVASIQGQVIHGRSISIAFRYASTFPARIKGATPMQ